MGNVLEILVVAGVVLAAVVYVVWSIWRKPGGGACGGCPHCQPKATQLTANGKSVR